jgi:hypothetical protein
MKPASYASSSSVTITQGHEAPSLLQGPRRLHYVYSQAVPQTHLSFLSVLQGIAFGVLILGIPLPSDLSWPAVSSFALAHYLYLPYITSGLIVLLVWNQYMAGVIWIVWPLSLVQSGLMFLMALVEVITFRVITSTQAWLVGFALVAFVGGITRLNNLRFRLIEQFESREVGSTIVNAQLRDGVLYVLIGSSLIAVALTYENARLALQQINSTFGELYPWAVYVTYLLLMLVICAAFAHRRQHVLTMVAKDSDLVVLPHGQVIYTKALVRDESAVREAPSALEGNAN